LSQFGNYPYSSLRSIAYHERLCTFDFRLDQSRPQNSDQQKAATSLLFAGATASVIGLPVPVAQPDHADMPMFAAA
jgi:hypothetical protein